MPRIWSLGKTISVMYGRLHEHRKAPAIPSSLASWPGFLLAFIADRSTQRFEPGSLQVLTIASECGTDAESAAGLT
jgi:hypothetical protein